MERSEIHAIVQAQREWFLSGATLPVDFRIQMLEKLRQSVRENEAAIHSALARDLGKSPFEGYMCETGMVLEELDYMIRHLAGYARPRKVRTPLHEFASASYVLPQPKGNVLIMSPWNYPMLLTLGPLVDALAAGNTALVKPSAYSPHTSALVREMLESCFDSRYVAVVTGGREENQALLDEKFDHIFFTGSRAVGQTVLEKAARYLTPVTLELGGKSPCIVDETADITLAARRIVFGKFLNCGQTCVAPDYVLAHSKIRDRLVEAITREIKKQFGETPLENPNYGKIISRKHFDRICSLMDEKKIVFGGKTDPDRLQIEPTVLDRVSWDDPVMGQEIFGPVLPVMSYESLRNAVKLLQQKDSPLALYLFTENRNAVDLVTRSLRYGGGCINDTIIHLATTEMGFGGFGASGMGSYHGRNGFETFSHMKSIVDKKTWLDLPMRYQPYSGFSEKLLRFFLK